MADISDLPMLHDIDAGYSPQYVNLARILRSKIQAGEYRQGDILPAANLARELLFQPAVVGVGVGELAAGEAVPTGAAGAGLVAVSSVVVTGPPEPPLSQVDQDCCQ
jgi:hypothetical protein